MKTRFAILLLALVLTLCLCACSDDPQPTVITKGQTTATVSTTTTIPTTTTATQPDNTTVPVDTETTDITTLPSIGNAEGNTETGDAIARLAISLIGTPYQSGGNGPDAFDNPGFVAYCYKQNGYTVPRKATQIITYGFDVNPEEIQPGDILVFCNEIGEDAGFVGIYIGDNQFVASTNPDTPTKLHQLNVTYWSKRFLSARRFS